MIKKRMVSFSPAWVADAVFSMTRSGPDERLSWCVAVLFSVLGSDRLPGDTETLLDTVPVALLEICVAS